MSFWVDAHAHIEGQEFDQNRQTVIRRAKDVGVGRIINASSSLASCYETLRIASLYPSVLAAVGIHPQEIRETLPDFSQLEKFIRHPEVVAVGETGLDYYWDTQYVFNQKEALRIHIELANQYRLPLVLHSRSSDRDLLEICQQSARKVIKIWHCFSGDEGAFQKALKMDFYFSLGGVITFPSAKRIRELIPKIPKNRILLETDSPYLAPQRRRGKQNEPSFLVETAQRLSEILDVPLEILREQIFQNSCDAFGEKIKKDSNS